MLNGLEGVELYGIFSLLLFTSFFIGVIIWTIKTDNVFIERMKNLPLEENSTANRKE